jgi:hypothetical protein
MFSKSPEQQPEHVQFMENMFKPGIMQDVCFRGAVWFSFNIATTCVSCTTAKMEWKGRVLNFGDFGCGSYCWVRTFPSDYCSAMESAFQSTKASAKEISTIYVRSRWCPLILG